jgi:hypothetical protein
VSTIAAADGMRIVLAEKIAVQSPKTRTQKDLSSFL